MKKLLPVIFSIAFILYTLVSPAVSFAQNLNNGPTDSRWVIDPEVTFIGKNARRSGDLLNWTLQNYNWVCVKQVNARQCDDSNNPIAKYWTLIVTFIVVPMLFMVILVSAIVIIVTRGKSLTIMRFIPRFVAVVLLIIFSYSLVQFFYQFTDLIQGFFLRSNINQACPPNCISDKDLLYVGWSYKDFVGLRLLGDKYAESAFTSLLLTKLTALTYFVMVFLLLVRKIILWFFIIVSPIFPILLLYYPVRNTGKIWIGEFFRWLLYAPLFAIFLNGLVYLWRNQIPLVFNNPNIGNASAIEYPTAVNILLGGPRQQVSPNNSVNLVETFALYVVSLIMLWIVILLPWILLQIFLDYAQNFAPGDTAVMKTLVNLASKGGGGPSGPQHPSEGGAAISLPFAKKFSVPIDLKPGPTGAAKEIKADTATISNATFNRPAFIPSAAINNASVNAQVLNAANVKLPSLRDIAKFDVALTSRDQSKQQDVSRFNEQLVRIANPIAVTNTIERTQIKEIREKIMEHNQRGNNVASSLLKGADASTKSMSNISNQKVKSMLQQMANPSLANATDRDKMTKLNSMLKNESSKSKTTQASSTSTTSSATTKDQRSSQLASSILSVNEKTSDKEVQKIKDQLAQSSNNQVSKSVTSAITQSARESSNVQSVLKQVANPASVTKTSDREQVTKLRGTLETASKQGNQLAASILSVNDKTSVTEIEALQQRIQEAKDKGEPIATELASVARTAGVTTLPSTNRVQTVSKEDYQAVKDMWKQNYQNQEVPDRAAWLKDDIAGIDETISLLSSTDQDKVQQGMDQVSNILPFLLVGGFSQTEIVEYLKAKQDAAKEVSKQVSVEEEEKVSVSTHHAAAQQTMAASMPEREITVPSQGQSTPEEEENESPLSITNTTTNNATTYTQPQIANEILNTVNVKIPRLRDIAQFETQTLQKDTTRTVETEKARNVLQNIANPSRISDATERSKFEKIRETLISEQQKGNPTAVHLLDAASKVEGTKSVLAKIANPSLATAEADKKRFNELHESLAKASKDGNQLATAILATKDTTPPEEIDKLQAKIQEEKEKGEAVAASVLPDLSETKLPDKNDLQPAAKEDFDEVEKMWEENYRTLPVPEEYGSDRIAWITADVKYVEETISLLQSPDTAKQQEAQKRVSDVMPILLLGGFSNEEMVGYLQAKLTAGQTVLPELQKEEEGKVAVGTAPEKTEEKTLTAEEKSEGDK